MTKFILSIFLFLLGLGQYASQITIKVTDGTLKPINNASVFCENKLLGHTTATGVLKVNSRCKIVKVKAVGYYPEDVIADKLTEVTLTKLEDKLTSIETVILNDDSDPQALKILDEVVKRFEQNMPSSLPSYSYKSYEKFSVDIDEDSLKNYTQSLDEVMRYMDRYSLSKKDAKQDSTIQAKEILAKSKLFLWERAQEYLYSKQHGEKVNVLDNRVSGLQNPIYEMMAIQANRNRLPKEIRPENRAVYRYFLTDNVEIDGRENYVIRFREITYRQMRQRQKFNGYLYIDKETYGIKKIESNSKIKSDGNKIIIWKLLDGKWFPESEIVKMKMATIDLKKSNKGATDKNLPVPTAKETEFQSYAYRTAIYFDHRVPGETDKKEYKGYTYEIKNADGKLLEQYRKVELSPREQQTYATIDSLGKVYKVEEKTRNLSALLYGKYRRGMVDFDLSNLVGYTLYEGFRVGINAKLNHQFNRWISPDAYIAYGFKDRGVKYGVGVDIKTTQDRVSVLRAEYFDDVMMAGRFNETFWDFKMKINNAGLTMNNDRFMHYRGARLGYTYDLSERVTVNLGVLRQREEMVFPYAYKDGRSQWDNSAVQLAIHYLPNSRSMMTPEGRLITNKSFPEFYFNAEQGFNTLGGELNYTRLDALVLHSFKTVAGRTGFRVYGGIALGDAPVQHQFAMSGLSSWESKFNFNLTSYLGFITMPAGKYYNDRFVGVYLTHRLPFYFKSIGQNTSSFDVIYRGVIGNMKNPEFHQFDFQKMDRLYQEVGVEWNNFMSSFFNLGLFYRVGYYAEKSFKDNFGVQFKLKFLEF